MSGFETKMIGLGEKSFFVVLKVPDKYFFLNFETWSQSYITSMEQIYPLFL